MSSTTPWKATGSKHDGTGRRLAGMICQDSVDCVHASWLHLIPLCGAFRWVIFDRGSGVRRYEHACGSEMDSDDAPFVAHRHSYAIVDFFGIVNSMGLTLGQHNWYFLLLWNLVVPSVWRVVFSLGEFLSSFGAAFFIAYSHDVQS